MEGDELVVVQEKWGVSSATIQREAARRLIDLISSCGTITSANTNSSTTTPYGLLQKGILHNDEPVFGTCMEGLVKLVKGKYFMDGGRAALVDLLNVMGILSAASLDAAITAVVDIVCFMHSQPTSTSNPTTNTATSLSSDHLVTIINTRGDAWFYVISSVIRALSASSSGLSHMSHRLSLFTPCISQLLKCNKLNQRAYVHTQLAAVGRRTPIHALRSSIFAFLTSFVPYYRVDTIEGAAFCLNACEEIIELSGILVEEEKGYHKHLLSTATATYMNMHLVQMCFSMRVAGMPLRSVLLLLQRLVAHEPLYLTMPHPPIVSVALVSFLPTSTIAEQNILLDLLSHSLDSIQKLLFSSTEATFLTQPSLLACSHTTLQRYLFFSHALAYPLLQIISSGDPLSQQKALQLLHKAENLVAHFNTTTSISNNNSSAPGYHFTHPAMYGEFLLLSKAWSIAHTMWSGEPSASLAWLRTVAERMIGDETSAPTTAVKHKHIPQKDTLWQYTPLLVSPFLTHPSPHSRAEAARLYPILSAVSKGPHLSLSILPLLTYRLAKEEDSCVVQQFAYSIPGLANHKACVGPILSSIFPLLTIPVSRALAIRLVAEVWNKQERVFEKLKHLLIINYSSAGNTSTTLEERISVSSCIYNMCVRRPRRGEELMKTLSVILLHETHPTPLAFSVCALDALCNAGVLDFFAAWRVVGQNKLLGEQASGLVLVHKCNLLTHGAREVSVANLQDETKLGLLQVIVADLWKHTRNPDSIVRAAAYRSLTSFALTTALPQLAQVSANNYVSLLQHEADHGDVDSRAAGEQFVASVLEVELKERRGITTSDKSNAQDFSSINDVVLNLPKFLSQEHQEGTRPALRSAVAGGLLWTVRAAPESKGAAQVYLRSLKELTTDIESREWLTLTMLPTAWFIFMERCFNSCLKSEQSRKTSSAEQRVVVDSVVQQILTELTAHQQSSATPATAMNGTFALAGLAAALPASAYTRYEEILDTLFKKARGHSDTTSDVADTSTNDLVRFAGIVALAHLAPTLRTTDFPRLREIIALLHQSLSATEQIGFGAACGLGIASHAIFTGVDMEMGTQSRDIDERKEILYYIINTLQSYVVTALSSQPSGSPTYPPLVILGAVLGLGHTIPALETAGDHSLISRVFRLLASTIDSNSENDSPNLGDLSHTYATTGSFISIAPMATLALQLDAVPTAEIQELVVKVTKCSREISVKALSFSLQQQQQQQHLLSATLYGTSSLIHGLLAQKYTFPKSFIDDWIDGVLLGHGLTSKSAPVRVGAVVGLANILGCNLVVPTNYSQSPSYLSPALVLYMCQNVGTTVKTVKSYTQKIVAALQFTFHNDDDNRVCRIAGWVIGALARTLPNNLEAAAALHDDIIHLPAHSLIKCFVSCIQSTCGGEGIITRVGSIGSIITIMGRSVRLPPLQWPLVLKTLMKAGFGEEVRHAVVKFTLILATAQQSVVGLLSDWTLPNYFTGLELSLKIQLLNSVDQLLGLFASSRAKLLVRYIIITMVSEFPDNLQILRDVWCVLERALQLPDLSPNIISDIHDVILEAYQFLPSPIVTSESSTSNYDKALVLNVDALEILNLAAFCISKLAMDLIFSKLASDLDVEPSRSLYLSALLAIFGYIPIAHTLHRARTWFLSNEGSNHVVLSVLMIPLVIVWPMRFLSKYGGIEASQWILDTLDAVTKTPQPAIAGYLLGYLCIACSQLADVECMISQQQILLSPVIPKGATDPHQWDKTKAKVCWVSWNYNVEEGGDLLPYTLPKLIGRFTPQHKTAVVQRMNNILQSPPLHKLHNIISTTLLAIDQS